MGDYVPFSFAPRSPMLYVDYRGGVQGYAGGQTEVVHLVSSVEAVRDVGLSWVFTDGHPEIFPLTDFYNDLKDLDKIDWKVMASRYWHDTNDDPDRKRRRQAEFLVHNSFPWELIAKIGVREKAIESQVLQILQDAAHKPEVKTERAWYY